MYTIYINNTLALAVHEIYRHIFGPPTMFTAKKPNILTNIVKEITPNTSQRKA